MKKRVGYVVTMLLVLVFWAACDRIFDQTLPSENHRTHEIKYVSFANHGCSSGLSKTTYADSPYLSKHRLSGDTLTLTIRYLAQCCPAFRDSVSLHDATVDISLADTSALQCDCICEFVNDFAFLCPDPGALRVRFGWIGAPFDLDTLIQID